MEFLIVSAHAQSAAGGGAAGLAQFLPFVLLAVIGYFMLFRPQQQQQKKHRAMLAALKRGDRVITAGGIIGTVQKLRDGSNEIELEIAPGVRVTALRDTLTGVLGEAAKAP